MTVFKRCDATVVVEVTSTGRTVFASVTGVADGATMVVLSATTVDLLMTTLQFRGKSIEIRQGDGFVCTCRSPLHL